MSLIVGVVMDPIAAINIKKDSTFAMLLEAQRRGHRLRYMQLEDLYLRDGEARSRQRGLQVEDDPAAWFQLDQASDGPLSEMDVVLMRKDPPFDMNYVYATYLLELAQAAGTLVVNDPQALRDANEKLFTAWFPQCCVPTLVSRDVSALREFVKQQRKAVVKPLDGMGGQSIFQLADGDPNTNVILETITAEGQEWVMAQAYIEEIADGDKRILLVDGEAVPYALARIPGDGDFRGNLARGGRGVGLPLGERDRWICEQVAPELRRRGILFAGLDVIGDYLTEVNVTSPTCIRELDAEFDLNIAGQLFAAIEDKIG